jgi:CDP-diacylglycerol--serine O-phosphatidyltransferase
MRRAVYVLPNGFTLANLFFGIWAIVSASRGQFSLAGTYIVLGGISDALDGRVARATRTGTRFGEELDSLVDAISFGLAPGLIMYFAVLNREGGDWLFVFLFAACAVMRLARFNVEQAGRAKTHFHGLPSPAAGMTLATYYWFSQSELYTQTVIGDLPWHQMLRYVILALSFLMISNVPYPAVPTIGFRTLRGILASVLLFGAFIGLMVKPDYLFPALVLYIGYGLVKAVLLGLMERLPTGDALFPGEGEALAAAREADGGAETGGEGFGQRRRRRRRRRRDDRDFPTDHPTAGEGGA